MESPSSKPIIICVDDEPLILKLYARVIGRELSKQLKNYSRVEDALDWSNFFASFRLKLAKSGYEAIEIVKRAAAAGNQVAVGFFDVRMPGMNGVDTIKEILKIDPMLQCVVVTGYTDETPEDFSSLPLYLDQLSYINKPFSAQEILQTTINQLSAWRLKKEQKGHLKHIKEINLELEEKVKARTKELAASEARFRNLVESIGNWIWNVSPTKKLLFINKGISDCSKQEIEKKGLKFLEEAISSDHHKKFLARAVDQVLGRKTQLEKIETSKTTHDQTVYYSHDLSPTLDDQQNIIGVQCITRNITKEKRSEFELVDKNIQISESNRYLSLLLDLSQTVSSSLDINNILNKLVRNLTINLNASFCRIAFLEENLRILHIKTSFFRFSKPGWEPMLDFEIDLFPLTFIRQLVKKQVPLIISRQDLIDRNPPHVEALFLGGKNMVSGLMIPLVLKGEIIGLVYLGEYRSLAREKFTLQKISLCQTILNNTVVAIENARLFSDTQKMFLSTIKSLAITLDAKDPHTNNHSRKVSLYAEIIAQRCGLDERSCERLRIASLLHDIGKIGIQDRILQKPARLNALEFDIIKQHPEIGERIIRPIESLKDIAHIIKHHHERYDGNGYPFGLKRDEIPLGSRILSIADSFDAMTCVRVYRKKRDPEYAFKEITACSGTQFDPEIAQKFTEASNEIISKLQAANLVKP